MPTSTDMAWMRRERSESVSESRNQTGDGVVKHVAGERRERRGWRERPRLISESHRERGGGGGRGLRGSAWRWRERSESVISPSRLEVAGEIRVSSLSLSRLEVAGEVRVSSLCLSPAGGGRDPSQFSLSRLEVAGEIRVNSLSRLEVAGELG